MHILSSFQNVPVPQVSPVSALVIVVVVVVVVVVVMEESGVKVLLSSSPSLLHFSAGVFFRRAGPFRADLTRWLG